VVASLQGLGRELFVLFGTGAAFHFGEDDIAS
jgi:hypothetical protein